MYLKLMGALKDSFDARNRCLITTRLLHFSGARIVTLAD